MSTNEATEEWCREQLANLQIAERRLATLAEIRCHLEREPDASNCLTLRDIFDCIGDNPESAETEETHLACDILSICMTNLSINESETQYYLMRCLKHTNGDVQLIAINEINRNQAIQAKSGSTAQLDSAIVIALLESVKHPSEKVAWSAIAVLVKVLSKSLANSNVRASVINCLGSSELVKCRVFDLAVQVARVSAGDLDNVEFILTSLSDALDTDDILLQMNVLDILGDLALVEHGLVYLENKGILAKLMKYVQTLDGNPLMGIMLPGYFKFFGTIASIQPKRIIDGFSHLIQVLFQTIIETDLTHLPIALDTLGHLTKADEGSILLHEHNSEQLRHALSQIGLRIRNLPTQMQTRVLNCLEIMTKTETIPPSNRVSSIKSVWIRWFFGSDNLNFLLDFCRNPFTEIRMAAITLLAVICTHGWGTRMVADTAGFVEYLLDRREDFDKEVKQEKYAVIKVLADSTDFDEHTTEALKRYVQDGAFYVTGLVEVAVEGL